MAGPTRLGGSAARLEPVGGALTGGTVADRHGVALVDCHAVPLLAHLPHLTITQVMWHNL